jgi:hypothetical protein
MIKGEITGSAVKLTIAHEFEHPNSIFPHVLYRIGSTQPGKE